MNICENCGKEYLKNNICEVTPPSRSWFWTPDKFCSKYCQDIHNRKNRNSLNDPILSKKIKKTKLFSDINKNEIKEIKITENKFDYFIDVCEKLIPFLPIDFPIIDKNSYKKSLLVETRILKHNEFIIKNTIQKLGNGWGHIIYCSNNNFHQIKKICDTIDKNIEIRILDKKVETRNDYNNLLLDINFWNEINCDKVLIYQTDTFIFKDFDDDFLKWDYIGAAWGIIPIFDKIFGEDSINFIHGNGGLSFRTTDSIKKSLSIDFKKYSNDTSRNITLDKIPEDVFYSFYIFKYGKYPKNPDDFSFEYSYNYKIKIDDTENSFGCHKIYDFFNTKYQIEEYINTKFYNYFLNKKIENINRFKNTDYEILTNNIRKNIKITVLISLYNYDKYITKCINSVLKNTFKEIEILVVNDCSTDNSLNVTIELMQKSNIPFKIINKKTNTGVAHCRNLGIDNSCGEYIFILDSDNEIYYNCLEKHYNEIKNKDIISCYGIVECFDSNGKFIKNISNEIFNFEKLKKGNYIDAMAMFNKKELIKIGKYSNELLNYGIGLEDYELWLRIGSLKKRTSFIKKPLSRYLIKKNSMINITNKFYDNNIKEYLNKKYL